ncbi:hypothetical protein SLS62_010466 [Diatrype stigma]|uniref:Uncharacterized protein n=1 Tax=Diatrype stigma TaxID=117547 RepID=A0AAN9YID9_9PEZI
MSTFAIAVSPTATNQSSRSPTPSAESHHEVARSRGFRSRSPTQAGHITESAGVSHPIRRKEETSPHESAQQQQQHQHQHQHAESASAQKKPVIDQRSQSPSFSTSNDEGIPSSPPDSILKGKGAPRPLPRPLLTDLSQYTNPHLNIAQDGTTLEELAHLVRLSKYQERKRANTRIRLQRSLISTALSARLTRCGQIAQRNLADLFRKDDKAAFASLFDAVRDVRNSCDAARRYAILEPEMESLQSPGPPSSEALETPLSTTGSLASGSSVAPFFNDISASAREAFLNFLTQLRTNTDYLATRLCALSASELQALTVFHDGLEPVDTVLPFHPGPGRPSGRSHASNAGKSSGPANNAVERFLSFQRHDPLSALIHTSFANSAGPDSAEDKRRTEIWAIAFARLISTRRHSEPTLVKILNVWSTMRDWSGQGNMEWYLMRILEDGAFLLDRAEDQRGTRFNVSDWTTKDAIAAEEFYDRAVEELFEVVDDEDATGIPEGVIELGNEVLRRLDKSLADDTRRWFVYKWIFSTWLPAVVIHPESHGLMAEYHITEYARQKILKEVATRAQKLVIDRINNLGNPQIPVSIPPKIKSHIENIVGRFMPSRTKKTPRLLPARSITSLRETAEVRPYLVLSPADLLTLVNALFPERRPRSARSGSIRSGAPSISGFSTMSQPISIENSRSNFDTSSVLSVSASSALSDATTSREPLLEEMPTGTPLRYSPPVPDTASQRRLNKYEDDGYRLRLAMHEMVQVLGTEVVAGSCHPCAERWAVLFISADGNNLSLQMTYDPDEDPDEENSSTTSDTGDDEQDEGPELDKDYHLLRDSILKLVEDFEIPRGLEDRGTKTTLSNRASGLKRYRSKNKVVTPARTMGSRNPYRKREEERLQQEADSQSVAGTEASKDESESQPVLVAMLAAASSQSRVQSDYVGAHLYWKTLQRLNAISSPSLRRNGYEALLNIFSRGPRDSIHRSAAAIEEYDAVLVWLKQSQERHEGLVESMIQRLRALRDKMWYVTDVHNSSPYTDLRSFCSALKIMGAPKKWEAFKRQRAQLSRGPVANYIYRSESQTLDILAAGEEQGGPNKLRDEQAEKTTNWLEQFGIDNFCHGEERIHRFCCEVDLCVGKLVGDTMADAPVLWAGPLYGRDKRALDNSRGARERDNSAGVDDAVSVISDPERRYVSPTRRPASAVRDLRSMSSYNLSQVSVDSSRFNFSRASTVMSDILDSHEYFGGSSPINAIDSTTTYWSPFQSTMPSASSVTSRAQSPTTSVTNLSSSFSHPYPQNLPSHHSGTRPGTSASSNETIHLQQLSEEKQRFYTDLRRTLTSLLLSDLGSLVFARGSETDEWFDKLGQECIERREAQEPKLQRPVSRRHRLSKTASGKRAIEKKKSSINLRGVGDNLTGDAGGDRSETSTIYGESSSAATSDTISLRSRPSSKSSTPDFPYKKAYQRLLRMFSVHPNPSTKLNALYELQQLIIASLSSGGRRARWALRHQLNANEDNISGLGGKRLHEQTIESVRERRSQTIRASNLSETQSHDAETRSVVSSPANPDTVVNILRSLFKDASVRPKSLFRDLQYIASFVPATMLDDTDQGKAFWNAGLAALSLKQDVCKTMVEVADEVVKAHSEKRRASNNSSEEVSSATPPITINHSLEDAGRMLTITAKERDPTAQRELALFILSYPELVEKPLLPLSKPREVFKQAVMEKFGARTNSSGRHATDRGRTGLAAVTGAPTQSGQAEAGRENDVRSDPALMCVTIHWMKAAEQGGDELATRFIRQNEMGLA